MDDLTVRDSSRWLFFTLLLVCLTCPLLFPIFQAIQTEGYVFYTNGFDEGNYLQYDFSKLSAELTARKSQFLVSSLHELGLSGGWINFCFDLVVPLTCVLLLAFLFRSLKLSRTQVYSLLILSLAVPLVLNSANPLVEWLFHTVWKNSWLPFVTLPHAATAPILRSPEPQSSYLLMCIAVLFSTRFRSTWPMLFVAPFLYSFLVVPWLFIAIGVLINGRTQRTVTTWVVAFVFIGLLLRFYFNYFTFDATKALLLESSAPLVSFTGTLALICYWCIRKKIPEHLRFLAATIALSPFVAANQQIISGWVAVPSNSEQYFGVYAVLAVCTFAVRRDSFLLRYSAVLCACLYTLVSLRTSLANFQLTDSVLEDKSLLEQLKTEASRIAVNNLHTSVRLNLVQPKQSATFFSHTNVYLGNAPRFLPDYLCAKKEIRQNTKLGLAYQELFTHLDGALRFQTHDHYLNTLQRKSGRTGELDVDVVPEECSELNLQHVIVP